MAGNGIILMDVDGTVSCGRSAPRCRARPGMGVTIELLDALGYELAMWSAGGAQHAWAVAQHCGYAEHVHRFYGKPDGPMSPENALCVIGETVRPVLQVDDELTERVGDWPFFLIEGWYGDTTTTPSGLIVPQEG